MTPNTTHNTKAELLRLLEEKKRLSRDEMATLVLLLCTEQPRTARELSEILHRNVDHVRNATLSPLIQEGQLECTGAGNDPNVAYRATNTPGS